MDRDEEADEVAIRSTSSATQRSNILPTTLAAMVPNASTLLAMAWPALRLVGRCSVSKTASSTLAYASTTLSTFSLTADSSIDMTRGPAPAVWPGLVDPRAAQVVGWRSRRRP